MTILYILLEAIAWIFGGVLILGLLLLLWPDGIEDDDEQEETDEEFNRKYS